MFSVIHGRVTQIIKDTPELQEVWVQVDDSGRMERAYNYPQLYRRVEPGDQVRMNSAAVQLGLGTGGRHFILPEYPEDISGDFPGHIMKLRYTPWQMPVLAAEEENSPYHAVMENCDSLDGAPVVAASLHSMLPGIILGFRETFGGSPRVCYIMTDGAALPIALSDLVRDLKKRGWLDVTITAGNAFGGDLEAVSLPSALLLARHGVKADLIVVALGPGIVGTGTKMGFSGVEQSWVIDLTCRLGGKSIAVPRISGADPRERHRGISHHTLTMLELACNPPLLPISRHLTPDTRQRVESVIKDERYAKLGQWIAVDHPAAGPLFAKYALHVKSMGRDVRDDPDFFQSTVAAGCLAANLLKGCV